jgi:hypothetical protein
MCLAVDFLEDRGIGQDMGNSCSGVLNRGGGIDLGNSCFTGDRKNFSLQSLLLEFLCVNFVSYT